MTKLLKKLLFWLFIILIAIFIGYLCVLYYIEANCSRGINYITNKYKIEAKDLISKKYQEYVYEDIVNCDSLWLKKCTNDDNLAYEYILEDHNGVFIVVKEYKDGTFSDNYEKGVIRKEYLDKLNKGNPLNEEEQNIESN